MVLLFLLALLLAWPTFGLSLIAWFAWFYLRAKNETDKVTARQEIQPLLEAVFTNRHAEFFNALEIPIKPSTVGISPADAHQCGRHIMNYIGHNRDELQVFLEGLKRWAKEDGQICHPADAALIERRLGGEGDVYRVSLRAVDAIVSRNPQLPCFKSIDLVRLKSKNLSG